MLDIDIQSNQPAWVYITDSEVSVTRIGDIILLEKDLLKKFDPRKPWEYLCEAAEIESRSGSMIDIQKGDSFNILSFYIDNSSKIEKDILFNLKNQKVNLAILQIPDTINTIKFSCAIATECFLYGTKNDGKSWMIDYKTNKSNMIYNK